ncbi:uncharacterized protein Snphl1 [Rattus norvegicus]|uniref:uncharacterized protein Snphl1 n=1 Tax=Rattus norvegicus TaxID=10116 RepID=UPI0019171F88|nr:uncharacterized protein LOC120101750 [Rattus norvegicus]
MCFCSCGMPPMDDRVFQANGWVIHDCRQPSFATTVTAPVMEMLSSPDCSARIWWGSRRSKRSQAVPGGRGATEAPSSPAAASSPGSTRPPQSRRLARLRRSLAQRLCSRCSSRLTMISNLRRWGRERQGRVSAGSRSLQARRTRCPPRARAVPVLGRRPAPPHLHSWVRRVRLGGGPGGPRGPCHHLRRLPWFRLPREGSRIALPSPS